MVQGEESSWRMERAALPLNQALAYGVQAHAAAAAAAAAPPTCFLYFLSLSLSSLDLLPVCLRYTPLALLAS
jgi:hypothetical protein